MTTQSKTCRGPGQQPGELCGRPRYGAKDDCDAHTKQRERDRQRGGKGDDSCLRPIRGPRGKRVEDGVDLVDVSTRLEPDDAKVIGDLGRKLGGKGNGYFSGAHSVLTRFARGQLVAVETSEARAAQPSKVKPRGGRKSAA